MILFIYFVQHLTISFLQIINKKKLRIIPLLIGIFCAMILLISNKAVMVGTDYDTYNQFFNELLLQHEVPKFYIKDSGWGLYAYFYFIGKIFRDFRFAVIILILFQLIILYKFFKKYSYHNLFYFSFLTYYSFFYNQNLFNAIKQGVAISLVTYSINLIYEKKVIKYFVILLLGTIFHTLTIILIPFYWLLNQKIKTKKIMISFLICFIIIYFLKNNICIISKIFSNNMRYYQYFLGVFKAKFNILNFFEVYIPFVLLLFLDVKYELREKNRKNEIFINLYYCYAFLYLITLINKLMGYRFVMFLAMGHAVIYPYIYYKFFEYLKIKKLFYLFYPVLMLVFLYFRNLRILF